MRGLFSRENTIMRLFLTRKRSQRLNSNMTMQAELAAVGAQGGRGCPSPDVTVQLVIYQTGRPVLYYNGWFA